MSKSYWASGSSAYGLQCLEFDEIPKAKKRKLVKLMARIAERAYRRGVQQGICVSSSEGGLQPQLRSESGLHRWRYQTDLNKARGIDGFCTSSLERLFIEERCLMELGFREVEPGTENKND